ncbi:hypothetical protein [Mycobacterium leprae]|uniref:hypothetical protein n=1 Tax=Mycobacterium leprae TaxID=1769 RepID=UPI000312F3C3|nr:hypothetical protein [Mycobacterium leprae]
MAKVVTPDSFLGRAVVIDGNQLRLEHNVANSRLARTANPDPMDLEMLQTLLKS